jgi:hypothetical protein
MKRIILIAATVAALIGAWVMPARADTGNVYLTQTQYTWATSTGACVGYVMSVSGSADVTMFLQNFQSGSTCTGWLEQSRDGSAWGPLSYQTSVPSVTGSYSWTKTLNFALHAPDVRVCLSLGPGSGVNCSPAATVTGSSGAAQEAYPVMYTTGLTSQPSAVGACGAALSATTTSDKALALVNAVMYNLSAGVGCTAWLEQSSDGGTTWHQVSASHQLPSVTGGESIGFTSLYPDGLGKLARACVQLASATSPACTAAW